jgi:hypothetical protein
MRPTTKPNYKLLIPLWAEGPAVMIPILQVSPAQAAFTHWLKPLGRPWPRKRFICLNAPNLE